MKLIRYKDNLFWAIPLSFSKTTLKRVVDGTNKHAHYEKDKGPGSTFYFAMLHAHFDPYRMVRYN
jgi:hypothetical protein